MNHAYEQDRLQCQCKTTLGKRCQRIATYSGGGMLRCDAHHQKYLVQKANDFPLKQSSKTQRMKEQENT